MREKNGWLMRTESLHLQFGGVTALTNVSANLKWSEILAVIGPNGAGKSCLLNCMNGFYHPQEGRIFFEEKETTSLKPHEIAKLGVARTFQGVQLFQGLSVIDNLLTGRHIYLKTNPLQGFLYRVWTHREEMQERRKIEIIDFLEIKHIRHKLVGELSYGLQEKNRSWEGFSYGAEGPAHG
jgi:branched-chain amino acid transport system ATP-binding protein